LGALLAGNALPMIVLAALKHEGAIDYEGSSLITIHVTSLLINAMLFGGAIIAAMGKPSRLFAFPAPTSVIVAWQLFPGMVVMSLATLATTVVFNTVFDLNWPLWGPALFTPVALAACAACFWLTEKSPWHMLAYGIPVLAAGAVWFHTRYGMVFRPPEPRLWREVTAGDAATMLVMAGIAYYAATVGVARSRCGEFLKTPEFLLWLGRVLDPAPTVGLPFRTPAQAQFWFEWRQKGWGLPGLVVIAIPFGFVIWLFANRNPQDLFDVTFGAGGFLTFGGLILGLLFGNIGPADGKLEMGHFLATRPMTSADMSRTMLRAAGISVLIAWVLWTVAFLIVFAILLLANVEPRPHLPKEVGGWYFPATLLGAWLSLTVMATIGHAGRPTLYGLLFCGVPALALGAILFSHYALSPAAKTIFAEGITMAVGAIYILGTAWAFAAARRRALIGPPTVWAAMVAWSALCILGLLFWSQHRSEHLTSPVAVHVIGLFALVVFPLAAAPLALTWNRNR